MLGVKSIWRLFHFLMHKSETMPSAQPFPSSGISRGAAGAPGNLIFLLDLRLEGTFLGLLRNHERGNLHALLSNRADGHHDFQYRYVELHGSRM